MWNEVEILQWNFDVIQCHMKTGAMKKNIFLKTSNIKVVYLKKTTKIFPPVFVKGSGLQITASCKET